MKNWPREREHVAKVFPDAELIDVTADYEAFHAIVDGVRLIFYPHKTTAGHHHLRVRNGTPQRRRDFESLASILAESKQPSCTFSVRAFYPHAKLQQIRGDSKMYAKYWEAAECLKTVVL